jgi:hypothetical protein
MYANDLKAFHKSISNEEEPEADEEEEKKETTEQVKEPIQSEMLDDLL